MSGAGHWINLYFCIW